MLRKSYRVARAVAELSVGSVIVLASIALGERRARKLAAKAASTGHVAQTHPFEVPLPVVFESQRALRSRRAAASPQRQQPSE